MRDPSILQVLTLVVSFLTLAVVFWYTRLTGKLLSAQTRQSFENTFFQLLRFHHDIVDATQLERFGPPGFVPPSGRLAFSALYNDFVNHYASEQIRNPEATAQCLASAAYLPYFKSCQYCLGHYFRNLYHLIKFVDKSCVNHSDKIFYTHLVRAQLSRDELLLLFYNCHSSLGKDKFYPLVVRYGLLKNMDENELASRRLKLPGDDLSLYPPGAYGKS